MNKKIIKYYLIFIFLVLVTGGCKKSVSHSPVEPTPSQGKIFVNSTPKGFTIYQNGRNTGRHTPDSLIFLDPGEYEITLKRLYWKDTSVVVTVTENGSSSANINYIPNLSMYGKLGFYSNPIGVSILVNDSLTNRVTPATLDKFLPGTYKITFRLENHRDAIFNAIVESGKIKQYSASLKDTSVWLDYKMSDSGIQSDLLSSIVIDHKGIKWIGSFDNGLISFDDRTFTNFNTSNSAIPDNQINCISVDAQNNIWVGTTYGIGVYNGSSWKVYDRYNSGLQSEIVNTIKFDASANAWIGTTTNLTKFDGINWTIYNTSYGRDYINDIYISYSTKFWLATYTSGIYIFNNGIFTPVRQIKHNYPSLNVSSVAADHMGIIWFCFDPDSINAGGCGYWDESAFTTIFNGSLTDYFNHIYIDNENNKWISTSIGFSWYDSQNIPQLFTTFNSLITTNNIKASVRDNNGVVWIATYKGGLNKFKVDNL